jgi:hypothetical protein
MTCLIVLRGKNKILFANEKFFEMNYNKAKSKGHQQYTQQVKQYVQKKVPCRLPGIDLFINVLINGIACEHRSCHQNQQY